jgi:hypothetical protein
MPFHLHIAGAVALSVALLALTNPARTIQIPAPHLISPVNGAVMDNGCKDRSNGITWDFDWSDVHGATAYQIRVWKNPAIPLINNVTIPTSDYHYDSPKSYIINTNLTGWGWRVRARVGKVWGPWSITGFFRMERLNTDCP